MIKKNIKTCDGQKSQNKFVFKDTAVFAFLN